ncbi:MAG TPA: SCO family protein [Vicinamibacterales bacterium]|nr:SCO family protein [Vicinamibacterales bacterium]
MVRCVVLLLAVLAAGAACRNAPPEKQYELKGQILAIAPERREVTIRHEEIKGLMMGMTMPFTVQDAALLEGREPGDLVTATLVVWDTGAHLTTLTRTGHEAVAAPAPSGAPAEIREGELIADEALVDQDGASRPIASLRGHRIALTFVYTRCPIPDFCPRMNRQFAQVQKAIQADRALADVRLLTVTLDPAYDRPPVLKAHARHFGADPAVWSFLTGNPEEVKRFGQQFGVYTETDAQDPSQIIHNLRTAVIGPDGRVVKLRSGKEWTPSELIADLKATPAAAN